MKHHKMFRIRGNYSNDFWEAGYSEVLELLKDTDDEDEKTHDIEAVNKLEINQATETVFFTITRLE